jgi:MoaA/NifB/PqqE/SkfB family radical SAM enzyme
VFLRQDFMEIYTELSMMGLSIGIYTNATMITPKIAKSLGRTPPSRVEVTLYGASPETYARVTGNPYGFEQALGGIDLLLAEGITLDLRTTVIRDNYKDYDKIAELAEKRKVMLKIVSYISPRRDGTPLQENMRLLPIEMVQYQKHAQESYIEMMKRIKGDKFADSTTRKNDNAASIIDKHPFKCNAGRSEFWVTWDGRMTPCGTTDEPATLPFEKGFLNAWKGLKDACVSIPVCQECIQCSLKSICCSCPGRLKVETGFFDRPAPYLCEFAKEKQCSISPKFIYIMH